MCKFYTASNLRDCSQPAAERAPLPFSTPALCPGLHHIHYNDCFQYTNIEEEGRVQWCCEMSGRQKVTGVWQRISRLFLVLSRGQNICINTTCHLAPRNSGAICPMCKSIMTARSMLYGFCTAIIPRAWLVAWLNLHAHCLILKGTACCDLLQMSSWKICTANDQ